MKSVTITIKDASDRELFQRELVENLMDGEFKRCNTTDWYIQYPDDVCVEEAKEEVEEFLYLKLGFIVGKDYEF